MAETSNNKASDITLNAGSVGSGGGSSGLGGTPGTAGSASTTGAGIGSAGVGSSTTGLGGDTTATTPLDTAGPSAGAGAAGTTDGRNHRAEARSRFSAALEEARAGLEALRADAASRGADYRAMASSNTADWVDDLKQMGEGARRRAGDVAAQGKTRASDGLSALGRAVSDTATVIDERLGPKYGDYARSAARNMQEAAARLEAKEFTELGDDVRAFVRSSPGTALGVAAVTGFFLARLFGAGSSKE